MNTDRNGRLLLLMLVSWSSLMWRLSQSTPCALSQARMPTCALPEQVDAASTRVIRLKASPLVQAFEEKCKTYYTGDQEQNTFRTADGTCNHILNLGAAHRPPKRLLPSFYDDGVDAPRVRQADNSPLPSPTDVSRTVHPSNTVFQNFTVALMQWGQFIDHDITGFPISSEVDDSITCCVNRRTFPPFPLNRECFPILLTAQDRRFRGNCMEFARSVAARDRYGKKIAPREQVNSVTSFIDGSMVYGSDEELQLELRAKDSAGRPLATMRLTDALLLPDNQEEDCIANRTRGEFCFLAGDTRVNEQPLLATMHTLFVRVHNQILSDLRLIRPGDSEEKLFQQTRKMLGGMIQNIHYGEWLPLIIGDTLMKNFALETGSRSTYIPNLDPRIANGFSTAAFRFGHSLIPDAFVIGGVAIPLRRLFERVAPLFDNFNNVLLALAEPNTPGETGGAQRLDRFFTEEVTGHLFETREARRSDGLDLVALNIQRGRDHGLPPYNYYRKFCGLPPFRNFTEFVPSKLGLLYKKLYSSVDEIDLFTGIMSEPVKSGIVGETLGCLLATQFHDLKFGDRFFFETNRLPEGFEQKELDAIRNVTMAHLCCQVKGIESLPRNVFRVQSAGNPLVSCFDLRQDFARLINEFRRRS